MNMQTLYSVLDDSHSLGHRCVTRVKGGFERGGVRSTPGDGEGTKCRSRVLWVVSVDRLRCYVHLYAPFGSRPFVVQSLTVGVASAPDLCPHLALQGVFWVFVVGKGEGGRLRLRECERGFGLGERKRLLKRSSICLRLFTTPGRSPFHANMTMIALARRFGTNVTLLSGQWYCSGIASCDFCEGVLSVPRRREMNVALPYASWDTVRMKWRPSLKFTTATMRYTRTRSRVAESAAWQRPAGKLIQFSFAPRLFGLNHQRRVTRLLYFIPFLCCVVQVVLYAVRQKPAHAIWLGKFGDSWAFTYSPLRHTAGTNLL
jgi:hypothetical protein